MKNIVLDQLHSSFVCTDQDVATVLMSIVGSDTSAFIPSYPCSERALEYSNNHFEDAVWGYQIASSNVVKIVNKYIRHREFSWLAGNISAYVADDGVISVRCPFDLIGGGEIGDNDVDFVKGSWEWQRVQCLLEVANREWCDVVVWAPDDFAIKRYHRDLQWRSQLESTITNSADLFLSTCTMNVA